MKFFFVATLIWYPDTALSFFHVTVSFFFPAFTLAVCFLTVTFVVAAGFAVVVVGWVGWVAVVVSGALFTVIFTVFVASL